MNAALLACFVAPLIVGAPRLVPPPSPPSCGCQDETPPGQRTVFVRLFNQSRMTPAHLDAVLEAANRIWLPYDVRLEAGTEADALAVMVSDGAMPSAALESSVSAPPCSWMATPSRESTCGWVRPRLWRRAPMSRRHRFACAAGRTATPPSRRCWALLLPTKSATTCSTRAITRRTDCCSRSSACVISRHRT